MLKSYVNEQEVTFPNVPPRQVLNDFVAQLNREKNTDDYEFVVDDQTDPNGVRVNLGHMRLVMKKDFAFFEKNPLAEDEDIYLLNRLLTYKDGDRGFERRYVLFVLNYENTIRASILHYGQYHKCRREPFIFSRDMSTEVFRAIYDYLANNQILFIIDQLSYWAAAYEGLDDYSYRNALNSEFVQHLLSKAQRDFAELKLIIEAANL